VQLFVGQHFLGIAVEPPDIFQKLARRQRVQRFLLGILRGITAGNEEDGGKHSTPTAKSAGELEGNQATHAVPEQGERHVERAFGFGSQSGEERLELLERRLQEPLSVAR
jgi:hypothetical protein